MSHLFSLPSDSVKVTSDDAYTPRWVFDAMGLRFDLDVAAPPGGPWHVPADRYYTAEDDGLTSPWDGLVWCNPPYSTAEQWIARWAAHPTGCLMTQVASRQRWRSTLYAAADALYVGQVEFQRPDGTTLKFGWTPICVAFRGVGVEPPVQPPPLTLTAPFCMGGVPHERQPNPRRALADTSRPRLPSLAPRPRRHQHAPRQRPGLLSDLPSREGEVMSHSAENDVTPDLLGALGRAVEAARAERRPQRLTNACKCGDCYHPAFGPDTDGEPCEWCQDCACSVTEHHAWTDRMGDVWRYGIDGLMHTPETRPFPREHVEKKWGPLRPTTVFPPAKDGAQ